MYNFDGMSTSTLMLSDVVFLAQLYTSAVLSSQETDLRFACKPGKAVSFYRLALSKYL